MKKNIVIVMMVLTATLFAGSCSGAGSSGTASSGTIPNAPTGLSVTPGDSMVTITWNSVSDATSYNLYSSTTAYFDCAFATKITSVTSPYNDIGLSNGTHYYYRASAVNGYGESACSSISGATPLPPMPGAPTGVSATPGDGTRDVTISWTAIPGADSYNIYFGTSTGVSTVSFTGKLSNVTSPYVHSSRQNGTTYYYIVTAVNLGGETASSEVSATPNISAPVLTVTALTDSLSLTWTAVNGATGYYLYYGTSPGVTITTANNSWYLTGTSKTHTLVTDVAFSLNTTYYYIVIPYNNGGNGMQSNEVSGNVSLTAPALTATSTTDKVTLTWPAVNGASKYYVYFSTSPGVTTVNSTLGYNTMGYVDNISGSVNGTTVDHSLTLDWNFANGNTYYYMVIPWNSGGYGIPSNEVSATPMAAPAGLSAIGGTNQITLNWNVVAGATGYNIYYGSTLTGVTLAAGNVQPPYIDTPLAAGSTLYSYIVTAINTSGESLASIDVSASTNYATYANHTAGGTPGVNWFTVHKSATLNNIAWSGSLYVGVKSDGTIYTSPDGVTWTTRTSGSVNNLLSVIWSGTQFVVVGSNGTILTSPDGVTWTTQTSGTLNNLTSVIWSGTQFVVVGVSGTILTSPDGVTWTARVAGSADTLQSVIWNGTKFVTVAIALTGNSSLSTSVDGVNWISVQLNIPCSFSDSIAWDGTTYVLTCLQGILTSTDLVNWTKQSIGTNIYPKSVLWSGTQFIAVTGNSLIKSTDGIVWSIQQPVGYQALPITLTSVVWGNNEYLAVGIRGEFAKSADGLNWSIYSNGTISRDNQLNKVIWTGTKYVAVGGFEYSTGIGRILTSNDGKNWTETWRETYVYNEYTALYDIAYNGTTFVAVGVGQRMSWGISTIWVGVIVTSTDGVTWTRQDLGQDFKGVTWNGAKFIAVGAQSNLSAIYTSVDGITWNSNYAGVASTQPLQKIATNGTLLVSVGFGGYITTSPDAVNWTAQISGTTSILNDIIWDGTKFFVVGNTGNILTSVDGVTWTAQVSGVNYLTGITHNGGLQYVAVGGNTIIISP